MQISSALLELQQVDLGILRDRKALEAIPEMGQIVQVRAKQKELARRTTKIVGLLKDQQIESDTNKENRCELTRQVEDLTRENESCTDFRRVQNNNAELDRLAKRIEKIDFNQKKVDAELERLQGALEQAHDFKSRLDAREAELVEAFKNAAEELREDLRTLVGRREVLVDALPADLFDRYQQSCEAHNHVGVGELRAGACTACGVEMQQSQLDALRGGPAISTCPVCGRIIVVRASDE